MPDNSASPNGPQQNGPPLDQLSMLLANLPRQGSPLAGLTPNPAPMPVLQGSTQDLEQRAAQPRQPAAPAPQPPQPSDDPAITSARAGMDASSQRLQDQMSQFDKTRQQIAAVPPVNAADYRPKWTDRLLGGITGALSGFRDPAEGVKIGGSVTNRSLNRAQSERQSQLAPLLEQLNTEREEIPMLTQANESAWRQFGAARDVAKDKSEADLRASRAGKLDTPRNSEEAFARASAETDPDEKQRLNALGGLLKEVEQGKKTPSVPKNADEALAAAYAEKDPDKKQQLMDMAKALHKQEIDRSLASRPPKEDKSTRGTPNQFAGVESKKQAALGKAHSEYVKATRDLPTDPKAQWTDEEKAILQRAQDDYAEATQEAQNGYEAEDASLGGEPSHVELSQSGKKPAVAAQSASTPAKGDVTPTAAQWKNPSKGLRVQQPSGAVQIWKLTDGKPTLVSEEKGAKQ